MSALLKYWFNIGNFYETIRPCMRVLKCFGLLPFSITRVNNPSPRSNSSSLKSDVKFIDIIIFALWQIFFLQMVYVSWPKDFYNTPFSRIITIVSLLLSLSSGVLCSSTAVLALVFRNRFIRMVHLVEETDHMFSKLSTKITHAKIHLVSMVLVASTIAFNALLIVIDIIIGATLKHVHHPTSLQYMYLYFYVLRLINFLSTAVFITGLYGFRERLRAVNQQIRTYFLEKHERTCCQPCVETTTRLQGLIMNYSHLCDALQLFCTIFVWQPMFLCFMLIVSAVFMIVSVCNMLVNAVPVLKALVLIYSTSTMFFALYFLLIVRFGSDLKKEGKVTAILVHKAINQSSKTPVVVDRLLLFSRYLQHQTPAVSCGLFCFDWTLALSIVSALATYSIIMIQFELGVPRFFISAILQLYAQTNTTFS